MRTFKIIVSFIAALFALTWVLLRIGLSPSSDADFVRKLSEVAQSSTPNHEVKLSQAEPSEWDLVCYYRGGGPSHVTRDFQVMLNRPGSHEFIVVEGNDLIMDDDSALAFLDLQSSEI